MHKAEEAYKEISKSLDIHQSRVSGCQAKMTLSQVKKNSRESAEGLKDSLEPVDISDHESTRRRSLNRRDGSHCSPKKTSLRT